MLHTTYDTAIYSMCQHISPFFPVPFLPHKRTNNEANDFGHGDGGALFTVYIDAPNAIDTIDDTIVVIRHKIWPSPPPLCVQHDKMKDSR